MTDPERPINPRIQKAAEELRDALDKLKSAQDPLVKDVLRKEALSKLYDAADITEAVEMQDKTKPLILSDN